MKEWMLEVYAFVDDNGMVGYIKINNCIRGHDWYFEKSAFFQSDLS